MDNRSGARGLHSDQANPSGKRKDLLYAFIFGGGVIIISCLLLIIVFGVFYFREQIPFVSNFFPTRVASAGHYSNSEAGISLSYPSAWLVQEWHEPDQVGVSFTLAPTQEIIDAGFNSVETGVRVGIDVTTLAEAGEADVRDISDLSERLSFIGVMTGAIEPVREFSVGGMPAASLLTTLEDAFTPGTSLISYLVLVLREEADLIQINCVCPRSEWNLHKPICNSIVDSIRFLDR